MALRIRLAVWAQLAVFLSASAAFSPVLANQPALSGPSSGLAEAFSRKHLKLGSPVLIRIYKQSSELELWVLRGPRFVLLNVYPICRWSGRLGPKLQAGDRQSPEGVYTITAAGLIVNDRWHRAMNINYPNRYDRVNSRTGSGILIHGRCRSIGCFALSDANVEEVYEAVRSALAAGQRQVQVVALPLRFRNKSVEAPPDLPGFWQDLSREEALFHRDRVPAPAWLCGGRYVFEDRLAHGGKTMPESSLDCSPLNRPVSPAEAAAMAPHIPNGVVFAGPARTTMPWSAQPTAAELETTTLTYARTCDGSDNNCKLIRTVLNGAASCPMRLANCRTAHFIYMKSIGCPVKYPRCRFFVGPALTGTLVR